MPGIDETPNMWRARQLDPGRFNENTYKTMPITEGVQAVIGDLKGDKKDSRVVQTYLFDKDRFKTAESVRNWLDKEGKKYMREDDVHCAPCHGQDGSLETELVTWNKSSPEGRLITLLKAHYAKI